jgi:hypothetical protein
MSTTKQIESCTNRLAMVDHDNAANFWAAMHKANGLAVKAFELRRTAWDLYRKTLGLPPKRGRLIRKGRAA